MARKIPLIVNDFKLTTWLISGAFIQSLVMLALPSSFASKIPFFLLGAKSTTTYLEAKGILGSSSAIIRGRWTARRTGDNAQDNPKKGVVMFVLGARTLHPMGRFAKGFKESRTVFADMWDDAESNRERWGFLGRTEPLISDTFGGMSIVWLTYWRDLEGLRGFAVGDSHRKGWNAYLTKEFPNLGIMHETYHAPNRSWENIYHNWPAFGLGETTLQKIRDDTVFMEAKDARDRTLFERMGKV